jgi:flagellar assembly factor FliW
MTTTTALHEVRTTRFGELETIEVADEALLTFPEGLPGFEDHTRFALTEHERLEPFLWLQSLHDPLIGFLVVEPRTFVDDYAFDVNEADVELLRLSDDVQPRVLSVLVVPEDVRAMTANLQAPLVINDVDRLAKQVILTDDRFPLRYPVFGGDARRDGRTGEARRIEPKHAARRRAC